MEKKLVKNDFDTPANVRAMAKVFYATLYEVVQGSGGAQALKEYHARAEQVAHALSREYTELLLDSELELELVAGRFKYISADLITLKACAEAAGITDGRCRQVGLECASKIEAELKALRYTLGLSQPSEQAAA